MIRPYEYIVMIKGKKGFKRDAEVARHLGVTPQNISSIRSGKSVMSDELALKVAKCLGVDLKEIISANHYHQTKNKELKGFWKNIFKAGFCILCKKTPPPKFINNNKSLLQLSKN
jgi:transcriptional regulator with XRE-family HTH domain